MLLSLFATTLAFAVEPISSGVTLLTGVGATFDGNPASVKLQIQGELPLVPDEAVGLGVVLPLELTSSGESSFGMSASNTMFTFIPSLRVRANNTSVLRVYGDVGVGVAQITADRDYWLFSTTSTRTGWATRVVFGLEIGPAEGGVAVVIEPVDIDTLHFGDAHSAGYTARIGVGARF